MINNTEQTKKFLTIKQITVDSKGKKHYTVCINYNTKELSAAELIGIIKCKDEIGLTISNAEIKKVYGKDTIQVNGFVYTVAQGKQQKQGKR